jgi:hypothetical protein
MADEVKQITIEDILSDYHREILSPPAVKLYAAVWYRMGNRGVTEISMSNEEVSVKARVPMSGISKVQSELARMGSKSFQMVTKRNISSSRTQIILIRTIQLRQKHTIKLVRDCPQN